MNKSLSKSINRIRPAFVIGVTLFLFSCFFVNSSLAEKSDIEVNAVLRDTQKMSNKTSEMTLVWWIPEDFWRVSLADKPNVTEAQIEEVTKLFSPYLLAVVVDGKVGPFAGVNYKPEADIRSIVKIKDKQGNIYRPLAEDKIDPDTRNGLAMMQPIFVNMLGPMGENMHFFLFPATDSKGQKIADARRDGSFSVLLDDREFKWRLPLGSLLPSKTCQTCGEKLSGAYKFCPWDGTKL